MSDTVWASLSEPDREAWYDAGFSEETAVRWLAIEAIRFPVEADRWRDARFTAEEASAWFRVAGVYATVDAEEWRDSGFSAAEAAEWANIEVSHSGAPGHMDAIRAELWRDAGFGASEAAQWISFAEISVDAIGTAERWRDAGFVPKEAKHWILRGLSAEDARRRTDDQFRAGRRPGSSGPGREQQQAGRTSGSSNRTPTHYEVLGVSTTATEYDITTAFQHLARQFHPDAHPGASGPQRQFYEDAMVRVNAAHDTLQDSGKRTAYDERLRGSIGQRSRPRR